MATTTNYSWTTPDNTAYVKDGASAIRSLGSSVDSTLFTALGGAYPGLRLIKKQTIGSAVSSVTVTNAFSATYDAYRIVVTGGVSSNGSNNLQVKLGSSATGYAYSMNYVNWGGSAVTGAGAASGVWFDYAGLADPSGLAADVTLVNPFLAKWTLCSAASPRSDLGGQMTGVHKVTTSYTDFSLSCAVGTMTGGTIYVYGYGIS